MKKCGDVAVTGIDSAQSRANLRSGTVGIKVSIMPPKIALPDRIHIKEIAVEPVEEVAKETKKEIPEEKKKPTKKIAAKKKKPAKKAPKKKKEKKVSPENELKLDVKKEEASKE